MKLHTRISWAFLLAMVSLSACGTFQVSFEGQPQPNLPDSTEVGDPGSLPTATALPTSTPVPADPQWIEIRDEAFGFGFALPCWWRITYPLEVGDSTRTYTMASYDEAYFLQNSVKGWWIGRDYPDGAVKLDVIGFELESFGIDPALSTPDVLHQFLTSDMQVISSITEKTYGSNQAFLAMTSRPDNLTEAYPSYAFRISPERILLITVFPARSISSKDIQGLIASVALSPDQEVARPTYAPSDALIAIPETCPESSSK